jgi:hypothetical protein
MILKEYLLETDSENQHAVSWYFCEVCGYLCNNRGESVFRSDVSQAVSGSDS